MILSFLLFFNLSAVAGLKCENPAPTLQKNISEICDQVNAEANIHCNQSKAKSEKQEFPKVSYGIFSAMGTMNKLYKDISLAQEKFLSSEADCPEGCAQKSASIVEIETQPTEWEESSECSKKKFETIVVGDKSLLDRHSVSQSTSTGHLLKSFKLPAPLETCVSQAKEYAQEVVMAKNKFGEELEAQECPSPCTYSSVIQMTTHREVNDGCHVDVALLIRCGPPRKSAKWSTQARVTKSYRCEVTR